MKEIKNEVVVKNYVVTYVANDGTEFNSREECKKYEMTAHCIVMARVKPLIIKRDSVDSLFGFGSEEEFLLVVRIKTNDDLQAVAQAIYLNHPWRYEDKTEDSEEELQTKEERRTDVVTRLTRALNEKDLVLINEGYAGDGFWFIGTLNEQIESLKKLAAGSDNVSDAD